MTPSALACDWAFRMKVKVMLRAWGVPPQAPTITVAASTHAAFQITLRFGMAIACPADHADVKGLRWLGAEKA
jgi:hypothetical protein